MEKLIFALGIIEILICIACFFFKKKQHMLICLLIYNLILFLQYILQSYLTESLLIIIDIIRSVVFFIFAIKNLKPNLFVIILFEILAVGCCFATWQNWFSVFVLAASMISTYSYWQKNMLIIRILSIVASILLILNYVFTGLYTTIIAETITFMASFISIIVYRKELFNKTNNEQSENSEQKMP